MHTAQLLAQAIHAARGAGFQIREEPLDGAGGGHYTIRGQRCLLLDLTQPQREQLSDVLDALRSLPDFSPRALPPALAGQFSTQGAA